MSIKKDKAGRKLKDGERQRPDGVYEFRWTDKMGKRHSVYSGSLKDLREKERSVAMDTFDGIQVDTRNLTVNDWYLKWKVLKKGLKENTFQNYQYMYVQYVSESFGKMKLKQVKRSDVKKFYNDLHEKTGLKVRTIESVHVVLYQVFELAVNDDAIRYNPCEKALKELKSAFPEVEKKKGLTKEEERTFLRFVETNNRYSRWYPVLVTLFRTGMRIGECMALTWEDIDFDAKTIRICKTLEYFKLFEEHTHTKEIHTPKTVAGVRYIPMLPEVIEALKTEKALQDMLGVKCIETVNGVTDFVFLNRYGKTLCRESVNRTIHRIVRECNMAIELKQFKGVLVPKFSCHSTRHTFATRLNEAGINLKAAQTMLGHVDVSTTMNIYTDSTQSLMDQAIREFGDFTKEYHVPHYPVTTPLLPQNVVD